MKKVLQLNADFTPHSFITWQKAMTQILTDHKNGAYVVEYYDDWNIKDGKGREYKVPAVIALKEYINDADERASYTKSNIYARDKMTCQYCGQKFKKQDLNIDHVVPRSRWHKIGNGTRVSSFENTVTSCKECNSKKADQTCSESGMFPIKKPVAITNRQNFLNRLSLMEYVHVKWLPYIEGMISEQKRKGFTTSI